ncbi:CLUMA_CG017823, isoform A [Clunio marinus]|uniref:CLUMA_CG017823, isoform A n=1 Tax=Clunio marinus TaxID=568069 RepID=A0A1J1IWV2_9DIPT|nr:CLUMA_CG017823, isoform A [Clunio marinus]
MSRELYFHLPDDAPSTFSRDEHLENLPLPPLEDTLRRYYRSLLPFGTEDELKRSREIIKNFQEHVGQNLHKTLKKKAEKEKNWVQNQINYQVERWWEDLAYHTTRLPLTPYQSMVQPMSLLLVGVKESSENRLKITARNLHYTTIFWELIRNERLRPPTNPDGSIVFSANLFKRLFNACRIPGEIKDEITEYFKTRNEGKCSSTCVVIGRGKIFYFDLIVEGRVLTPQELLYILMHVRSNIENQSESQLLPLLTADERTSWAKNRKYLKEISKNNKRLLEIIESSLVILSFDEYEPNDDSDFSQQLLLGDFSSRWNDKSLALVSFKNGRSGFVGEHSAYDGTVGIALSTYLSMCLMEDDEPNWEELPENRIIPQEIKFKIDDHLEREIVRLQNDVNQIKNSVTVQYQEFIGYGKKFMKQQKIHPDSFVQMGLQLAYYKLHKSLAPTYETATMRIFYHGRTETVRSCSSEVKDWIDTMNDSNATAHDKAKTFKHAADSQTFLMNEARKGNGIDRHLFGLWCVAHENGIPIPEIFEDPLYKKSGGGGNFVLSTSTLGYSINVGFVAPMVIDGYGAFYTMLDDSVWMILTAYRDSQVTSSKKMYQSFVDAMNEIREILESSDGGKL